MDEAATDRSSKDRRWLTTPCSSGCLALDLHARTRADTGGNEEAAHKDENVEVRVLANN